MEATITKWLYVVKDLTDIQMIGKPVVCAIEVERETDLYFFIKRPTVYFDSCSRISKKRYASRIHKTPQEAVSTWFMLSNLKLSQAKKAVELREKELEAARNLQASFKEVDIHYPRE